MSTAIENGQGHERKPIRHTDEIVEKELPRIYWHPQLTSSTSLPPKQLKNDDLDELPNQSISPMKRNNEFELHPNPEWQTDFDISAFQYQCIQRVMQGSIRRGGFPREATQSNNPKQEKS